MVIAQYWKPGVVALSVVVLGVGAFLWWRSRGAADEGAPILRPGVDVALPDGRPPADAPKPLKDMKLPPGFDKLPIPPPPDKDGLPLPKDDKIPPFPGDRPPPDGPKDAPPLPKDIPRPE
jgi:hypothetical protein